MPAVLNLNGLDDPILADACPGFLGGQQSYGPPDQLQPTQAAALVNIDINDKTATTRRGALSLGTAAASANSIQGLFWFDTPSIEKLVAVTNATTRAYNEASWANHSGYVPGSATAQVCIAQLIEKIYFADGTSNLYEWDGTTLTDLGSTTGTPGDPPDNVSIIISAYGALWATGISTAPDTLWVSYFLDATQWHSAYGNIRVGQGEGDPITGMCALDDFKLAVFKRNSIYLIRVVPSALTFADAAHGLGTATITQVSETIGCVSHRSIARVGDDVYFLSDTGVHSLRRVEALENREVDLQPLSLPVHDVIERINWSAATTAAAIFWKNRYLLSLPLDDETTPSTVLVFNTLRQAWSGTWTGWQATCWAVSKASGNERLCFGRTDGAVYRWYEYIQLENLTDVHFQDATTDYESSVTTRAMLMNDALGNKSALSLRAEFFDSDATVDVAVSLDEQEPQTLRSDILTAVGVLTLPFTLPATLPSRGLKPRVFGAQHLTPFRTLQTEVSADGGKMALRAVILTGFQDSVPLEL